PRFLPLDGAPGRAARSFGASLDGGLLEFDEFSPSRRRSSAFSLSSTPILAACSSIFAACSSILASRTSTRRSRRSIRSSARLTHSFDHIRSILSCPSRPGRSGLHPVNGYPQVVQRTRQSMRRCSCPLRVQANRSVPRQKYDARSFVVVLLDRSNWPVIRDG